MSIKYNCIMYENTIMSENYSQYYSLSPNVKNDIRELSITLTEPKTRRIITDGEMYYGFMNINEKYNIICLSDGKFSKKLMMDFLKSIEEDFNQLSNYQSHFNTIQLKNLLREKTDYYNDPRNDQIQNIKNQINDVKTMMIENIDQIIERGENIDTIVDSTGELSHLATGFRSNATRLQRRLWWKNIKMGITIFLIFLILIFIILMIICHPNFSKCKNK